MEAFSRALAAAALVDGQHFTLPGFGTIEGLYISARIDHGAKRVEAPRLEVRWDNEEDPKAQTFAQMLVRTGASMQEAEEIQGDWLDALTTGESIEIGDLGSLVPDVSTGTCAFEADTSGLASAFSGKKEVPIEPLSKRALPKAPVAPKVAIETRKLSSASAKTDSARLRKLVPYASVAAIAFIAIMAIKFYSAGPSLDENQGKAVAVNQDRLNRSPREEVTTAELPLEQLEEARSSEIIAGEPLASLENEEQTDFSSMVPDGMTEVKDIEGESIGVVPDAPLADNDVPDEIPSFDPAALAGESMDDDAFAVSEIDVVIILGSFKSAVNAGRLTERIAAQGLLPYVDQPEDLSLTRVGATFAVTSEAEIEAVKAQMREQFNPNAWVLD